MEKRPLHIGMILFRVLCCPCCHMVSGASAGQGFLSHSAFGSTRVLKVLILNGRLGLVWLGGLTSKISKSQDIEHDGSRRCGPGGCLQFQALP